MHRRWSKVAAGTQQPHREQDTNPDVVPCLSGFQIWTILEARSGPFLHIPDVAHFYQWPDLPPSQGAKSGAFWLSDLHPFSGTRHEPVLGARFRAIFDHFCAILGSRFGPIFGYQKW